MTQSETEERPQTKGKLTKKTNNNNYILVTSRPFGLHPSTTPCHWPGPVTKFPGQHQVQHCPDHWLVGWLTRFLYAVDNESPALEREAPPRTPQSLNPPDHWEQTPLIDSHHHWEQTLFIDFNVAPMPGFHHEFRPIKWPEIAAAVLFLTHTTTRPILNFMKIGLQKILNYSRISHEYDCTYITYFKSGKILIRLQHELLNTESRSRPKCWQSTAGLNGTRPKHSRKQCGRPRRYSSLT